MTKKKVETHEELQAELQKAERRKKYYEQQEKRGKKIHFARKI